MILKPNWKKKYSMYCFGLCFFIGVLLFIFYSYPIILAENLSYKKDPINYMFMQKFFPRYDYINGLYIPFFVSGIIFFLHATDKLKHLPGLKELNIAIKNKLKDI